jgi:hypothetical protein
MRLVELPRPKPVIRPPQPTSDEDIHELADFPTDIPVFPSDIRVDPPASSAVERPSPESPDTLLTPEPPERPQEPTDSETQSTESE